MAPKCCPKCFSNEIDSDGASGESVCTNCGHVLEECAIVSEVQFSEGAGGQSSVVGQFVPENGLAFNSGPGFGGFNKDSRELTLANGRRVIQHLAGLLRLNTNHGEVAHRFFQQAVQRNFTQGRKTQTVIAVCLYIVCRKQKTSHMLIDFAEALQTDVYELGGVFLKFCKLLHIRLEPIDPSLFIHRFAAMLEFGDRTQQVSLTALRLVARMNRDWMISGRRPAGICGAGLVIAAKMHRFNRTSAQVAQVVRICDGTLRKRLDEFEETEASDMTIDQFHAMFKSSTSTDLATAEGGGEWGWTEAHAPPALKENRRREAELAELLARKRARLAAAAAAAATAIGETCKAGPGDGSESPADLDQGALESQMQAALSSPALQELDRDALARYLTDPAAGGPAAWAGRTERSASQRAADLVALAAAGAAAERERARLAARGAGEGDEEGLSDMDDAEIGEYIRSDSEARSRAAVWDELNRDYIRKQEEKARQLELNPEGTGPKRRYRKAAGDDMALGGSATALEATTRMLRAKNLSSKVNHAVLQDLFGDADPADA